MEHLIREFGTWLKQGFGWLVDVIVFGCLWGISQISRLLGTQVGSAPILKIVVLVSSAPAPSICVLLIPHRLSCSGDPCARQGETPRPLPPVREW